MGAGESSSAFGTCDLHGRTHMHMDPGLQLDSGTCAIRLVFATTGAASAAFYPKELAKQVGIFYGAISAGLSSSADCIPTEEMPLAFLLLNLMS